MLCQQLDHTNSKTMSEGLGELKHACNMDILTIDRKCDRNVGYDSPGSSHANFTHLQLQQKLSLALIAVRASYAMNVKA